MNFFQRIFLRNKYKPLNKITVFEQNLRDNYQYLQSINPDVRVALVLKSNAYGHGIELMGKLAQNLNVPFLCVDSIFEAYQLYNAKINLSILIMGYVDPINLSIKKLPFSFAVFDIDYAKQIYKFQKDAKLHIFIDSGMNREGIRFDQVTQFITELKADKRLSAFENIEGIMSHYSSADESIESSKQQLANFQNAVKEFEENNIYFKYKHISASAGTLKNINGECNIVRAGIAFNGHGDANLKPALRLTSTIAQVKELKKGESVGYSRTFEAPNDMKIAVLPIGYANGIDRRLSNEGVVRIQDKYCKIVGRVSMNIITVDVSEVDAKSGEEVEVISEISENPNSIKNIAKLCGTIEYDILVGLDPTIRREIV